MDRRIVGNALRKAGFEQAKFESSGMVRGWTTCWSPGFVTSKRFDGTIEVAHTWTTSLTDKRTHADGLVELRRYEQALTAAGFNVELRTRGLSKLPYLIVQ